MIVGIGYFLNLQPILVIDTIRKAFIRVLTHFSHYDTHFIDQSCFQKTAADVSASNNRQTFDIGMFVKQLHRLRQVDTFRTDCNPQNTRCSLCFQIFLGYLFADNFEQKPSRPMLHNTHPYLIAQSSGSRCDHRPKSSCD